jgi:hypothetical protein
VILLLIQAIATSCSPRQVLTTIARLGRVLLSKLGLSLIYELLFSVVFVLGLGGFILCEDGLLVCEAVEDAEDKGSPSEDLRDNPVSDEPPSATAMTPNGWGSLRADCVGERRELTFVPVAVDIAEEVV